MPKTSEKNFTGEQAKKIIDYRLISGLDDYIHSSLFNDVFLFRDLPSRYQRFWESEFEGGFDVFFTRLQDHAKKGAIDKLGRTHSDTLDNWIHPILESLGWYLPPFDKRPNVIENALFTVNDQLGNEVAIRPSLLIFSDSESRNFVEGNRKTERALVELRNYRPIPVATSYFNSFAERHSGKYDATVDQVAQRGDAFTALGIDHQTTKYLNILGQSWGIATDGACWRLYNREALSHGNICYYEFNLNRLYNDLRVSTSTEHLRLREVAKFFYWFFSKEAFTSAPISFIQRVKEDSKVYTARVSEDLKERFVHAMTIACNSFYKSSSANTSEKSVLELIRGVSESFIFNLLFIRSCESNRVLPLHQDYISVSLHNLINKLRDYSPQKAWEINRDNLEGRLRPIVGKRLKGSGTELYQYVCHLYDLVNNGSGQSGKFGFSIHGFKESLFSQSELIFFENHSIDNKAMIQLIFELFYDISSSEETNYRQIAFKSFTPRQLGSIYESFLGFKLAVADQELCYLRKQTKTKVFWQWVPKKKVPQSAYKTISYSVVRGDLVFSPDNLDRKATGSYYTPDYIVDHVVSQTLGPLVEHKKGSEILLIKVCDPTMGSGHFLLGALEFLTEHYVRSLTPGERPDPRVAKQRVLKQCLYGVDKNYSAVKLAKLSLWLATANAGHELEHLEDQLAPGDSIVADLENYESNFKWKDFFKSVFDNGGFDAVIGNPPYISMKKFPKTQQMTDIKNYCLKRFETFDAKSDFFCCFVEKSLGKDGLLKEGGRFGMVLSITFTCEDSFSSLRKLLFKNQIVGFSINAPDAFPGVGVRTANIVLQKNPPGPGTSIVFQRERSSRFSFEQISAAPQALFSKIKRFLPVPEDRAIQILKKVGFFGGIAMINSLEEFIKNPVGDGKTIDGFKNGIASGDNAFWITSDVESRKSAEAEFLKRGHKKLEVDKFFVGADINRYSTTWGKNWINFLPTEMVEHSRRKNRNSSKSKDGAPSARPREYYYDEKDPFYQRRDVIANSLITSDRLVADLDNSKKYWDINVNLLFPRPELISASALLGLLNSKLIGAFILFNARSNVSVTQAHLRSLPIKKLSKAEQGKIENLVCLLRESASKGNERAKARFDSRLDALIYKIYGLTNEQVDYVEWFVSNYVRNESEADSDGEAEAA